MVMDRPGRKAMLAANSKEIARLREELDAAWSTRCHLIKMYERDRHQYQSEEIDELRALVVNYEKGLLDEF